MLQPRNWLTRSRLSLGQVFDKGILYYSGCKSVTSNFKHAYNKTCNHRKISYVPNAHGLCEAPG